MITKAQWVGLDRAISEIDSLIKNSKNLQRDFLNLLIKEVMLYLKEITPKDTGETANSWFIEKRTSTSVTIANKNDHIIALLQSRWGGGNEIFPSTQKAMRFNVGGVDVIRARVTSASHVPKFFLEGLIVGLDEFNEALMQALISKHWIWFKEISANSPTNIKLRNISKTQGIGQGTKRSTNRGRGGGVKRRTGKVTNRRRMGMRRRTGRFITSKEVKMK